MSSDNKRYQVFVSSTFRDLQKERAEVIQALLELDCIPCGMEAFPAANETQWNWIKKLIGQCDYYVLIIGGKYGSINEETGFSYTEMEFDYAIEMGIPTISFIVQDEKKLIADKIEGDPKRRKMVSAFKEKVKKKMCKLYNNPDDLGGKVSRSLTQLKKTEPRTGWVRADSLKSHTSDEEIIRLMRENEELKEKLGELNNSIKTEQPELSDYFTVEFDYYNKNPFSSSSSTPIGSGNVNLQWEEIVRIFAAALLKGGLGYNVRKDPLSEYLTIKSVEILPNINSYTPFIKIEQEFLAFILLNFELQSFVNRDSFGWRITSKGKAFLSQILYKKNINLT